MPSLFLYLDFFTPLFFLFFIFFVSYLGLKVILKELVYKFVVDFLPIVTVVYCKDYKFLDFFLNNTVSKGFSSFSVFTFLRNSFIKGLSFNSVVVIIMFLFFLV
jgi:hypothetical protein